MKGYRWTRPRRSVALSRPRRKSKSCDVQISSNRFPSKGGTRARSYPRRTHVFLGPLRRQKAVFNRNQRKKNQTRKISVFSARLCLGLTRCFPTEHFLLVRFLQPQRSCELTGGPCYRSLPSCGNCSVIKRCKQERVGHPVSVFLLLRSLPLLDGGWGFQEGLLPFRHSEILFLELDP